VRSFTQRRLRNRWSASRNRSWRPRVSPGRSASATSTLLSNGAARQASVSTWSKMTLHRDGPTGGYLSAPRVATG